MRGFKNLHDKNIKTSVEEDFKDLGISLEEMEYVKNGILNKRKLLDFTEEDFKEFKEKKEATKVQKEDLLHKNPNEFKMIDTLAILEMALTSGGIGAYEVPLSTKPLKVKPQLKPFFLRNKNK